LAESGIVPHCPRGLGTGDHAARRYGDQHLQCGQHCPHPLSIAAIDSLAPNAVDRDKARVAQERELGRNARLRDAKPGDEVADGGRAFEEDGEDAQTRFVSKRARVGRAVAFHLSLFLHMQLKILSDRRGDGGGIAYLVKFSPPAGKLIKLVAIARSDEHVYILAGGYCNKAGEQLRWPGDYGLNPKGHPHSAFIGEETVNLAVYAGEPDEVLECTVIDPEPPLLGTAPRT